ncbi:hydrolase [Geomonas limicola]|uniref:Hydrolase n=1 Tax=Geomonas limicola TaxID=2740186 RepID=A0A6V8N939_9BACT|nr:MBL fold metallo-hydrolase [Geomonas limicola]GFO67779.1 hydrolase [Geomonas limicola]
MRQTLFITLAFGTLILMATTILTNNSSAAAHTRSALSLECEQNHPVKVTKGGKLEHARILWDFFFNKPAYTRPTGKIPVQRVTGEELQNAPNGTVYRLGHSTVLLKLDDAFWLTDPIFSDRASPLRFFGPERFHAPPISIAELPPIKAVIISHDHYDHLDHDSIMQLAGKVECFLTPLGVGDILTSWGLPAAKVRQLDWWQGTDVGGVRLVATPAQHFSGRGFFDRNRTQWASWVILASDRRLFFSGDSGYFDGFQKIGAAYGPFDLTMLEAGAYDANWPAVHMQPEETIQAHIDLKGQRLLPIHNGTFDLSMHSWHDPFDRAVALGEAHHIPVLTPKMGEPVSMLSTQHSQQWWGSVDSITGPEEIRGEGQPAAGSI